MLNSDPRVLRLNPDPTQIAGSDRYCRICDCGHLMVRILDGNSEHVARMKEKRLFQIQIHICDYSRSNQMT